jgi:hypothetical protein
VTLAGTRYGNSIVKRSDLPGLRRRVCGSLLVAAFLLTVLFLALVNVFLGDLLLAGRALSLFSGFGIGVALALLLMCAGLGAHSIDRPRQRTSPLNRRESVEVQ